MLANDVVEQVNILNNWIGLKSAGVFGPKWKNCHGLRNANIEKIYSSSTFHFLAVFNCIGTEINCSKCPTQTITPTGV